MPSPSERDEYEKTEPYVPPAPSRALPPAIEREAKRKPIPDMEDVITGRARLEDQLESYPELSEELEGLGDIIDMLRKAGQERRKKGEQILREEILGEPPAEDDERLFDE